MLLLWTVMLSARAGAQSGEPDPGMVPTVHCWSHISIFEENTVTCQLISSGYNLEDDEDEDYDYIKNITACCQSNEKCVEATGETVISKDLNPICPITLTALSKRGHQVETKLDLRKQIKPKSPQVYNVTLNQDQALVYVQTPYERDYLTVENQRFQIQLWSEKINLTQNMTSASMNIGRDHLRSGTEYHVKVRAIPWVHFQGTWSEWSRAVTFKTPPGDQPKNLYVLLWSVTPVVVVGIMVLMWKNKILTYMWPSIPHPKTTLEQIWGANKGLLLIYNPEEFSSLNVYSSVNQSATSSCSETKSLLSAAGTVSSSPSTDASLSNSSVRTEEVELLSQSSTSEGEPDVPTKGLPFQNPVQHVEAPETTPMDHRIIQSEMDNSYVTVSSFYQIKTVGTDDKTFATHLSAT
ncbi:interleukin-7 receptor subunit alpha [Eucyclogobius newberryi]|uniref:interleukin-7 receptor subunit alpha n=1 Tax=Eucyclogobius newberryi TaxID=166745 RepID=UPI003B5ABA16